MATPYLSIVKAAIPIIGEIVRVARPMFTKSDKKTERDALTAQQIKELQNAATQNSESVSKLAAQVEATFEAMEVAASELQLRLKLQQQLTILAVALGLSGVTLSLYVLLMN